MYFQNSQEATLGANASSRNQRDYIKYSKKPKVDDDIPRTEEPSSQAVMKLLNVVVDKLSTLEKEVGVLQAARSKDSRVCDVHSNEGRVGDVQEKSIDGTILDPSIELQAYVCRDQQDPQSRDLSMLYDVIDLNSSTRKPSFIPHAVTETHMIQTHLVVPPVYYSNPSLRSCSNFESTKQSPLWCAQNERRLPPGARLPYIIAKVAMNLKRAHDKQIDEHRKKEKKCKGKKTGVQGLHGLMKEINSEIEKNKKETEDELEWSSKRLAKKTYPKKAKTPCKMFMGNILIRSEEKINALVKEIQDDIEVNKLKGKNKVDDEWDEHMFDEGNLPKIVQYNEENVKVNDQERSENDGEKHEDKEKNKVNNEETNENKSEMKEVKVKNEEDDHLEQEKQAKGKGKMQHQSVFQNSRPYPLIIQPKKSRDRFKVWYDANNTSGNTNTIPVPGDESVDAHWFTRLWSLKGKLDTHVTEAITKMILIVAVESPEIFMDKWTILGQFGLQSMCEERVQRRLVLPFVNGEFPLERPIPWTAADKVYSIGHIKSNHWVCLEIALKKQQIVVYDSLSSAPDEYKDIEDAFKHLQSNIPLLLEDVGIWIKIGDGMELNKIWPIVHFKHPPQ